MRHAWNMQGHKQQKEHACECARMGMDKFLRILISEDKFLQSDLDRRLRWIYRKSSTADL